MRSAPRLSPQGALAFATILVIGIGASPVHAQQGIISGSRARRTLGPAARVCPDQYWRAGHRGTLGSRGLLPAPEYCSGYAHGHRPATGLRDGGPAGKCGSRSDRGAGLLADPGGAAAGCRGGDRHGRRHPASRDRKRRRASGRGGRPGDHARDERRAAPRHTRPRAHDAGGRGHDRGRPVADPHPRLRERRAPERPARLHRRRPDEHRPDRGAAADDRAAE